MENEPRTLEEIKKIAQEPEQNYIEKFAKITDDKKSLLLRIPQEIRKHFNIEAGDRIRFFGKFSHKTPAKLEIKVVKC